MTRQAPIGTGFGAGTTAREILDGIDLSGKVAIVTGGYSGLGLETTRALAGAGAKVVVPARRPELARERLAHVEGAEVDELDLSDLDSVGHFADGFLRSGRHADIVIAAAGIMACPETRVGPDWEAQIAINHFGHFALINRLWPALAGGARVVMASSGAHGITGIRWNDMHFQSGYDKWQAYGQSKTANILFAVRLDQLGQDADVRAFAIHPGSILTPLQRHLSKAEMVGAGWIDDNGDLVDPSFKAPAQGAATQIWAATSPQLDGMGGVYCEDCDIAFLATKPGEPGVHTHAVDAQEATRLWALSAELTGINAFGPVG